MIAGVCFGQMSEIFAGDSAAVLISGVSVIRRCPQRETELTVKAFVCLFVRTEFNKGVIFF